MEKTKSNLVIAARVKASEQREKEYYSKTLEEAHGPRDAKEEDPPVRGDRRLSPTGYFL